MLPSTGFPFPLGNQLEKLLQYPPQIQYPATMYDPSEPASNLIFDFNFEALDLSMNLQVLLLMNARLAGSNSIASSGKEERKQVEPEVGNWIFMEK